MNKVFKVGGMTCAHCEKRIDDAVGALGGVSFCKSDFRTSSVNVSFDEGKISEQDIEKTVTEEGYVVKHASGFSDWLQAGGILACIAAIYFVVDHTIGFDFIPNIEQDMSYGLLFLAGIFTSLHCVSMCGGINIAVCLATKTAKNSTDAELMPSLMYNLGRVVSYTALGGVIGAIGSVFALSPALQDGILIVSGGLMILTGLAMLGLLNFIKIPLPNSLSDIRKKALGKPAFVVGLANGFMPCGPLQMMQLYALGTGSALSGAIAMALFVVGTVPLMFALGFISTKLKGKTAAKFSMASALVIILLGAGMLTRLMPVSFTAPQTQSAISAGENVQVLVTEVGRRSYPAITVKKGVPVRWILNVAEGNLNGCNNRFSVPDLNITKTLVLGENVVEFTAPETGVLTYRCWMNMIRSTITVVE